jgi:hypothetical protein
MSDTRELTILVKAAASLYRRFDYDHKSLKETEL